MLFLKLLGFTLGVSVAVPGAVALAAGCLMAASSGGFAWPPWVVFLLGAGVGLFATPTVGVGGALAATLALERWRVAWTPAQWIWRGAAAGSVLGTMSWTVYSLIFEMVVSLATGREPTWALLRGSATLGSAILGAMHGALCGATIGAWCVYLSAPGDALWPPRSSHSVGAPPNNRMHLTSAAQAPDARR